MQISKDVTRIGRFVRANAPSIAFAALFAISVAAQLGAGYRAHLATRAQHHEAPLSLAAYARSGHYLEAVFENWESEFLQTELFVVLAGRLKQKGAADSRELRDEDLKAKPGFPWPVRRGGGPLKIHRHSLSLALFTLFATSFVLHARHGLHKPTTRPSRMVSRR
jgi:hypothetical protein